MEKKFFIPKISCGHCVKAIIDELGQVKGVVSVNGDPDTKEMVVEFNSPATLEELKSLLEEINYPAES